MDSFRIQKLNRVLRDYDDKLFIRNVGGDTFGVYRQPKNPITEPPHFIFPLTRDFSLRTEPVEWGIEPIMAHLRMIDGQRRTDIMEELEAQMERAEAAKKRDLKNTAEAYFSEARPMFKKAFADVNTSNFDMKKGF